VVSKHELAAILYQNHWQLKGVLIYLNWLFEILPLTLADCHTGWLFSWPVTILRVTFLIFIT